MTANNIGIFGGRFDPVHKAHIAIAEEFIKRFSLDILYVIPNKSVPKKQNSVASGEERAEMLKIAFSGNNKVRISDVEITRDGLSYTCDTLADIRALHPTGDIYLLVGEDWAEGIADWKNSQYIFDTANIVIAKRTDRDITEQVERLCAVSSKKVSLLENQRLEMSSTEFRNRFEESLLPSGVYEYIMERGLYGI